MGRKTRDADIHNGRILEFNARGLNNGVPTIVQTAVPTSLTATVTLMGLQGPGVVNLAQLVDSAGTSVRVRMHIDGTDFSASTVAAIANYPLIGSYAPISRNVAYENVPFRDSFKVVVSKATGLATNMYFQTNYRLVDV